MMFDFDTLHADNRYKLLTGCVVPRPIAWVVSQDAQGVINAAPFSFFNAFTDDPAVLGIGVGDNPNGSAKDTLANIKATGQFTVCLVSEEMAEAMNVTAIDFPPDYDELAEAKLATVPSSRIKVPRIADSPVALECETFQLIPIGRHHLVLGRVLAMHVRDDCVMNAERCYIDSRKLGLIGRLYGRGGYAKTTETMEVERIRFADWPGIKSRRDAED